MLSEHTISIAHAYWASHFGCSPDELFTKPFRLLTHGGELTDYDGAYALFRGDAVMASIPRDGAGTLRSLLSGLSQGCAPGEFAAALTSVSTMVLGPAYLGYAATVSQPDHPVRALGFNDAAALLALQQACSAADWESGGSPIEHSCSGVFVDRQLVTVAGYEVWGGPIAHISIVTHPGFRNRGYGRSAVAHLAHRVLCAGLLPQFRTLESNIASIRIAESLGFHPYAVSMAVRLNRNAFI
jgi:GNAT superfamily N-acetyltransferase